MPAAITAVGTWSVITDSAKPEQMYDTVENRFDQDDLNYRAEAGPGTDVDGYPEVIQFIGCFAAGYGVAAGAAKERIRKILNSMQTGEEVEIMRVYPTS